MENKDIGYSGTPLAKKLGIKSGFTVGLVNAPSHYMQLFTDMPMDVTFNNNEAVKKDVIHFFTKQQAELISLLPLLKLQIISNGAIWVSGPKKASKVATDVTEDIIRNYALTIGLVDIKVCAVDDVWSGLKLVIPVKERV